MLGHQYLRDRGPDLICANLSHPSWIRAFSHSGFLVVKNRRQFLASKELVALLEPFEEHRDGIHLTIADGDGPLGF